MAEVTTPSNFSVDAGLMENLKVNLMEKVKWQFSEVYTSYIMKYLVLGMNHFLNHYQDLNTPCVVQHGPNVRSPKDNEPKDDGAKV